MPMMHDLLGRLAQFGGEGALGALFLLSTVSIGIIGQRIWLLARRRIDTDKFVMALKSLLRAQDLPRAEALAQSASGSICSITLAGLLQAENGLLAVQHALDTAVSRERLQLEDKLILLGELGRIALLVGILGSLFDLLVLGNPSRTLATSEIAAPQHSYFAAITALSPLTGGLLVAIPAWLARSMLNAHVQRIVRECEFVAALVCSQLAISEPTASTSPIQPLKARRVAA